MFVKKLSYGCLLTGVLVVQVTAAPKKAISAKDGTGGKKQVILWRAPEDMASRNLFYGPGGKTHEPRGPFSFVKEDLDGTNPKFVVRDGAGVKWKVKMGNEVGPETAASRIVWGSGYFSPEDYFMSVLKVEGMPSHLHRGQSQVDADGSMHEVRLKRDDGKKEGIWEWHENPFSGTREFNALRVLMALVNNWDLKDVNNAVVEEKGESVYMVSDLGATFGSASRSWPKSKSKGDLESFQHSKFISRVDDKFVNFRTPARPSLIYFFNPKEYFQRVHMEWIGRNIPRDDARWMGKLLAQLTPAQIRDAFRAAGYSPTEAEGFAAIVQKRIVALTDL